MGKCPVGGRKPVSLRLHLFHDSSRGQRPPDVSEGEVMGFRFLLQPGQSLLETRLSSGQPVDGGAHVGAPLRVAVQEGHGPDGTAHQSSSEDEITIQ